MTNINTIRNLENRYHVNITREFFWMPLTGEEKEDFKIYTLDGCCWDKVIGYRSLICTLSRDKDALKRIADSTYNSVNERTAHLWQGAHE